MASRINTALRTGVVTRRTQNLTVLDIYTGAQPASANNDASGTLLASITGLTWAAAANGQRSVSGTPNVAAVAGGAAGWGRFRDAGDTERYDGAVGAEFTLADPNIVQGGTVTLTSATLSEPSGE